MSVDPSGCIETTWYRDRAGYGIKYLDHVRWRAHRWAWAQANGPIPAGMHVLHACDNPPCINVAHLWLGTYADNNADRDRKGRTAKGERHGWALHPDLILRGAVNSRGPRRGRAGRPKLNIDAVRTIRAEVAAGQSMAALGRRFGVSRPTISAVVHGKNWKVE